MTTQESIIYLFINKQKYKYLLNPLPWFLSLKLFESIEQSSETNSKNKGCFHFFHCTQLIDLGMEKGFTFTTSRKQRHSQNGEIKYATLTKRSLKMAVTGARELAQ